jgi:hypothetical protein
MCECFNLLIDYGLCGFCRLRIGPSYGLLWTASSPMLLSNATQGENRREMSLNFFWQSISVIHRRDLLHVVKSYNTSPTALLPLWRKSCYGFLSPLKIHHPRPGLNSRTSSRMASMITTRQPRMTTGLELDSGLRITVLMNSLVSVS